MNDNTNQRTVRETYRRLGRRPYMKAVGIGAAGMVGLAGCIGNETGTLRTHVTDQPGDIADFESCVVHIVGMWLGPDGAAAGQDDGEPADRERYDFDAVQRADLVELQDGATQLIDERDLDTGTYVFLQLDIEAIDATLEDGTSTTVEVPGEAPLTFNHEFEIREATTTSFVADFTPVQRGATGRYVLQPVAEGITVSYDEIEDE